MAKKKQLDGVELANEIMLTEIANMLVEQNWYGKALLKELQEVAARKEIAKRGKLRKCLDTAGIKTKFDLAIGTKDVDMDAIFGNFASLMRVYRFRVIKQSFSHRVNECM